MKTQTKIRLANDCERDAMADVTRESYREFAGSRPPIYWQRYEDDTRHTILTDNLMARIVAEFDGKIVGSVILCNPYEWEIGEQTIVNPHPEMRLLAVLPEYRNLKIGQDLIATCEEMVAAKGLPFITLHTTQLMKTAKAMYERRGYERFPEIDFAPSPDFQVFGFIKGISKK